MPQKIVFREGKDVGEFRIAADAKTDGVNAYNYYLAAVKHVALAAAQEHGVKLTTEEDRKLRKRVVKYVLLSLSN